MLDEETTAEVFGVQVQVSYGNNELAEELPAIRHRHRQGAGWGKWGTLWDVQHHPWPLPTTHSHSNKKKSLKTLSNVPLRAKLSLVENRWSRGRGPQMGHRYPVTLESTDFPSSQEVLDKFKINNITVINNMITITNSIGCLTMCQGVKPLTRMISFNPITNLRLRGTK